MIVADLKAYTVTASWNAVTRRIADARNSIAPVQSSCRKEIFRLAAGVDRLSICHSFEKPFGIATALRTNARAPAGMLKTRVSSKCTRGRPSGGHTHFSKKTHLHVECVAIAPPISGPKAKARAATNDMIAIYLGKSTGLTASEMMIIARLKTPAPPRPWKARMIILVGLVSYDLFQIRINRTAYS